MIFVALFIGLFYGYVSVKGQFCMNSGFSNVLRRNDTTKLKSFIVAILIQIMVLPLLFTGFYLYEPTTDLVDQLSLPPLFLIGNVVGGYLFGIIMHYSAGCGAGIFYKIGEKNSGAVLAVFGFCIGIYLTEKGLLQYIRQVSQSLIVLNQQPIWKGSSPIIVATVMTGMATLFLFLLFRNRDTKPNGAIWGWKKTGLLIGFLGVLGWISAILVNNTYGMAIMPGILDAMDFRFSWGMLFLIGIPLGAFWSTRHNQEKRFTIPKKDIIFKRILGGIGLGISGSIAMGCTVGHGLTFAPMLGIGSIVSIIFIFLGSGTVGYLTKK